MRLIPEITASCCLMLAVIQGAIAADTTAASAPAATQATKPAKVIVDREQLKKRLEDRGIQAKKKRDLAKQKALERQNSVPAAGN